MRLAFAKQAGAERTAVVEDAPVARLRVEANVGMGPGNRVCWPRTRLPGRTDRSAE